MRDQLLKVELGGAGSVSKASDVNLGELGELVRMKKNGSIVEGIYAAFIPKVLREC